MRSTTIGEGRLAKGYYSSPVGSRNSADEIRNLCLVRQFGWSRRRAMCRAWWKIKSGREVSLKAPSGRCQTKFEGGRGGRVGTWKATWEHPQVHHPQPSTRRPQASLPGYNTQPKAAGDGDGDGTRSVPLDVGRNISRKPTVRPVPPPEPPTKYGSPVPMHNLIVPQPRRSLFSKVLPFTTRRGARTRSENARGKRCAQPLSRDPNRARNARRKRSGRPGKPPSC